MLQHVGRVLRDLLWLCGIFASADEAGRPHPTDMHELGQAGGACCSKRDSGEHTLKGIGRISYVQAPCTPGACMYAGIDEPWSRPQRMPAGSCFVSNCPHAASCHTQSSGTSSSMRPLWKMIATWMNSLTCPRCVALGARRIRSPRAWWCTAQSAAMVVAVHGCRAVLAKRPNRTYKRRWHGFFSTDYKFIYSYEYHRLEISQNGGLCIEIHLGVAVCSSSCHKA